MVQLAVSLSHLHPLNGFALPLLPAIAHDIEAAGADQLVLSEHVTLGAGGILDHGPGGGPFPFPPDELYPEPLTALAAISGATRTARLCTNILIGPLRPAVLLAKTAATVDALSGGRLELGLGTGWYEREFNALGVPFARRGLRLEEQIKACRALWSGRPASFEGETVSFRDMVCAPAPIQPGGIPIWLGGEPTPATARRVAALADGWTVIGSTPPAQVAAGVALIHRARADVAQVPPGDVGRFPLAVRCSLPVGRDQAGRPDLAITLAAAQAYVTAGATVIQLPVLASFASSLDDISALVEVAAGHIHHLG